MFCPSCGLYIDDAVYRCGNCGTPVREPPPPEPVPATFELPMTAEHAAVVMRSTEARRRWAAAVSIGLAACSVALTWLTSFRDLTFLAVVLSIAAIFGLVAWVLPSFAAKDIRRGVCRRSTGPLQLSSHRGTYTLHVADRPLGLSAEAANKVRDLSWGTVEYSDYGGIIFEVRDEHGQLRYRAPGYEPAIGASDIRATPVGGARLRAEATSRRRVAVLTFAGVLAIVVVLVLVLMLTRP